MTQPKSDVLQGTLDLMVLKTLDTMGPMHGYGIAQRIQQLSENLLQLNQGTLYPADRFDEHFLAALDLLDLHWGGLESQAVGAWGRLAERVRSFEGTAIVSHEILATASRQQVRRALESFGDAEVHVVVAISAD